MKRLLVGTLFACLGGGAFGYEYGGTSSGSAHFPTMEKPLRDIIYAHVTGTCGGSMGGNADPNDCLYSHMVWDPNASGGNGAWEVFMWSVVHKRYFDSSYITITGDAAGGVVDPRKNHGPCKDGPCELDPVNLGVSNKWEVKTEYRGNGPYPLTFSWTYSANGIGSAAMTADYSFGANRIHNYARRLQLVSGNAMVVRPDGNADLYYAINLGFYAEEGLDAKMSVSRDANDAILQFIRYMENGEVERYDPNGRLVSLTNAAGFVQTMTYDANGRLSKVTDPLGRALQFTYDAATGHITRLDLPDGQHLDFAYNNPTGSIGTQSLSTVTYPGGSTKSYSYNEGGFVSVADPTALSLRCVSLSLSPRKT